MPGTAARDILESSNDFQETVVYSPTAILRPDGSAIDEQSVSFLLRVIISQLNTLLSVLSDDVPSS